MIVEDLYWFSTGGEKPKKPNGISFTSIKKVNSQLQHVENNSGIKNSKTTVRRTEHLDLGSYMIIKQGYLHFYNIHAAIYITSVAMEI